jgi:YggT family protein
MIAQIIFWFFQVLYVCIILHVVLSWLPLSRDNPLVRLVNTVADPILLPIRRLLERSPLGGPGMMLDFSPIIAIFLLDVVRRMVLAILP